MFETLIQMRRAKCEQHRWLHTYPEYNAMAPSSRRIRKKAWDMPRYFKSVKRASIFWPCICRRVLVVSIGNVPVTEKDNSTLGFFTSENMRRMTRY